MVEDHWFKQSFQVVVRSVFRPRKVEKLRSASHVVTGILEVYLKFSGAWRCNQILVQHIELRLVVEFWSSSSNRCW